jgi:hypothetical protein
LTLSSKRALSPFCIKSLSNPHCCPIVKCGLLLRLHRLKVLQMRCLRTICGVSLKDRVPNDTILDKCATNHIADMIKYKRLKWLGHMLECPMNVSQRFCYLVP